MHLSACIMQSILARDAKLGLDKYNTDPDHLRASNFPSFRRDHVWTFFFNISCS